MEGKTEKGINIAGIASNGVNIVVTNPAPKTPTKSDKEKTLKETYTEALKEKDGLDKEFKEVRKIKIGLTADITVGSVYRQINRQYIQDRHDSIGGSINSARMLASNAEEMAAYMPAIVGCSANDTKFQERVSRWFQNISIPVPMDGYEFNCDFRWRRKEDYLKYAIKEQTIIEAYENADKSTAKLLKEAINNYVIELNALESTRYRYGRPDNIEHYIAFRHCLFYPDVAKDTQVIHFNPRIRFYIRDEQREQNRAKRLRIQSNKARRNYLDLLDDAEKFKAMFVCYCASTGTDVITSLNLDESIKEKMLDDYAIREPEKFNKMFNNNNLTTQALIEELIAKGELVRSEVNQTILTPEAAFIGSNMKEAIAYFNNPENAQFRKGLEIKVQL